MGSTLFKSILAVILILGVSGIWFYYFLTVNNGRSLSENIYVPSCSEINFMKKELNEIYTNGSLHTVSLRLGFHACVGGCDGCINFDNFNNRGLVNPMKVLDEVYLKSGKKISRADFWALAATVVVERGVVLANEARGCFEGVGCPIPMPCFAYKWGREDCPTSPFTEEAYKFPDPQMGTDRMFEYFETEFGFNKQEVVAIMGGHTLGGAFLVNSGFRGSWIPDGPNNFDNTLYSRMIDSTMYWRNADTGDSTIGPRWQWYSYDHNVPDELFDSSMMFNTDFEVFYNLTLDKKGESVTKLDTSCYIDDSCGKNGTAPKSSTFDIAFKYAMDQKAFIDDFHAVFDRLLIHKTRELATFGGTCSCI